MSIATVLAPYIFKFVSSERSESRSWAAHRISSNTDEPLRTFPGDAVDIALVQGIQAGDAESMRSLVLAYADRLTRLAYTLVHSHDEAEEIAFSVLENVWKNRDRLQVDRSLKTYLFTSVRHRALDVLAHDQVRARRAEALEDDIRRQQSVANPEEIFFAAADADERAKQVAALREAIGLLSERHQLALHLRFEQGLSYPEMGKILTISDKAAQQIILRAIGTLRRLLEV